MYKKATTKKTKPGTSCHDDGSTVDSSPLSATALLQNPALPGRAESVRYFAFLEYCGIHFGLEPALRGQPMLCETTLGQRYEHE